MKNLLFGCTAAILVCCDSSAQKNNPQNSVGLDYVKSYNIIKKDYDAGKISALDQKTLDYYSASTPIKVKVTVEDAVIMTRKIKTDNPIDAMKSAGYSTLAQQSITKALNGSDVVSVVDAVKISGIPLVEKQKTLSLLSIIYNANAAAFSDRGKHSLIWAIVGAVTGGAIFGPPGILAGAAVGGMLAEAKE